MPVTKDILVQHKPSGDSVSTLFGNWDYDRLAHDPSLDRKRGMRLKGYISALKRECSGDKIKKEARVRIGEC